MERIELEFGLEQGWIRSVVFENMQNRRANVQKITCKRVKRRQTTSFIPLVRDIVVVVVVVVVVVNVSEIVILV